MPLARTQALRHLTLPLRAIFPPESDELELIEVLRQAFAPRTLVGVAAPAAIWVGAALLAAFVLGQLARLAVAVWRARRLFLRTAGRIDAMRAAQPPRPGHGLTMAAYDDLSPMFEERPLAGLAPAWHAYDAHVLLQTGRDGEDERWAPASAEAAFSEEALVDARINRSFYLAVPGLVTGLGLLLTFLAILIALLDVKVEQSQVTGLEGLVAGLSGKFVSSVVALLFASVFLIFERSFLHRLSSARLRLVRAIDGLVPRRTELAILADLQKQFEEQSVAMRMLNTDLAPTLNRSLSESMGPTLQRMAQTIDELNQLMRAAEAQKQESITGSLEAMLVRLEQSLTGTLDRMGQQFASSLSGSATQQFEQAAGSLGGLARVLGEMNAQSQTTQAALSDLISFARNSTQEQVALGRSQVEELTTVLRSLMAQMQESTGASLAGMTAALTGVVHDLSSKVTELGANMAATVQQSSAQASGAAARVVEQADAWSQRNASQLAELLEKHQAQSERMDEMRRHLETSIAQVRTAIGEHSTLAAELRRAGGELGTVADRAALSTEALRQIQGGLHQVAQLSAAQVEQLAEANRQQQDGWRRVQDSMQQYEASFKEVDRAASQLLGQLADHVRDYTQTTKQGFEQMVAVSNELIANAVSKLGGSIGELDEQLDNLNEVLGKIPPARPS